MGRKVRAKYEAENGNIHVIRLDVATSLVANNAEPAGAVNSDIKVKISKNNREHGLRPRMAVLYREVQAAGPDGIVTRILYARIPILSKAAWATASWAKEAAVEYAGKNWKVLERMAEDY